MDRRAFLKASAAAASASALPWRSAFADTADWRTYDVMTKVEILKPRGVSRAWVPLPLATRPTGTEAIGNSWSGNAAKVQLRYRRQVRRGRSSTPNGARVKKRRCSR